MRIVLRALRHILLWLLGVALGVAVLLGAVMAASYSFTTDGHLPDPAAQFGGKIGREPAFQRHVHVVGTDAIGQLSALDGRAHERSSPWQM